LDYRVELKPAAKRQAERLPHPIQAALSGLVVRLQSDPRFRGVRPVKAIPGSLRARLGDYRVIFEVDDARRLVTITRIARRDKAYKP
jgi:mRNA interferase RelE/StbE